ncbi:MAG: alanine dehydrogenase, partial [Actinobacteria bacterium]|nr:alanine dehydrogenase [Actinomycetota bacterium]
MIIGVPKEIKNNEYRVSVTPGGVFELKQDSHIIYVQKGAGSGSGYMDSEYESAGAIILDRIDEVYNMSELIVKVKEPI